MLYTTELAYKLPRDSFELLLEEVEKLHSGVPVYTGGDKCRRPSLLRMTIWSMILERWPKAIAAIQISIQTYSWLLTARR